MKRTLALRRLQEWGLIGLKPMHRALLRRSVERLQQAEQMRQDQLRELIWHCESMQDSQDPALLKMIERCGILIVDRNGLSQRLIAASTKIEAENDVHHYDAVVDAMHHCLSRQIRLLWHWSLRGRNDLLWCTELSFDGVIFDAQSMEQWLRVCLRRGFVVEGQSNSLLSGIRLPQLAKVGEASNLN